MGIGASAGGLPALTRLLGSTPSDIGMAFFVVVHLAPTLPTALVDLLRSATSLQVMFATDGAHPSPGVVYVAPPGLQLTMEGPVMRLGAEDAVFRPVDAFLRSLAASAGQRAIGILLSGAGSDGTLGLQAIREAAGTTWVQDHSATFPGMPRTAVRANIVDRIMSPEDMAQALVEVGHGPDDWGELRLAAPSTATGVEGDLGPLLMLLLARRGLDFRGYKPETMRRRILRRVVLRNAASLHAYLDILHEDPAEVAALCEDLLIKVTEFFREPEGFEALSAEVLPRLRDRRETEGPLRIWVVGCATGEEAYSIAMLVLEQETDRGAASQVQIFATDASEEALGVARQGVYSSARCAGVSQARLKRFFVERGDERQIRQDVREMCVFAKHDITGDTPFSRMDLVICRNVLIYFGRDLQERVLSTLHYALQPWGGLLLGRAESTGNNDDLFDHDNLSIGFHERRAGSRSRLPSLRGPGSASSIASLTQAVPHRETLEDKADQFVVGAYSPPGVVIDAQLRVLRFIGETSRFLANEPGAATWYVLGMVRPQLRLLLSEAITLAREQPEPIRRPPVRLHEVHGGPGSVWVSIVVVALEHATEEGYLVLFETPPGQPAPRGNLGEWARTMLGHIRGQPADDAPSSVRRELETTRSDLRKFVAQHEVNAVQLRTATQNALSSNEELQSTNEELQTAREEVLATNEELTTINGELETRNRTLARSHDDLTNLLASTALAIIVVGEDHRLRWFSPGFEALLKLVDADIGRPFDEIDCGLALPPLKQLLDRTTPSAGVRTLVTRDAGGRWHSVGVRPYRRVDGSVDGAVIAVVDVDDLKRAEAELLGQRTIAQWIVDAVQQPLFTLDQDLCVVSANPALCAMLATPEAALLGRSVIHLELGLETAEARARFQAALSGAEASDDLDVMQAGNPERHLRIRVHRLLHEGGRRLALVVVDDVTARRLRERGEAEMVSRVLVAQADERESLARELHDETGQALSALVVGLRGASDRIEQSDVRALVDQLRERARELLDAVGRLARGLHPPSLDTLGLQGALTELAEDFSHTHAVTVDLQFLGPRELSTVPKTAKLVLYRAAQEALTNVARHAAASRVVMHVTGTAEEVSLHIEDDGHGFSPASAARSGIGLVLMRRRLALVQGSLRVHAAPTDGTTLHITVPIRESDD